MNKITMPNGTFYVHKKADIINSLFEGKQTASGYYKKYKNRIVFYNLQNQSFIALIANPNDAPFFVSCSKLDNGKTWYMYSTDTLTEKIIGIDTYKHGSNHGRTIADRIWSRVK